MRLHGIQSLARSLDGCLLYFCTPFYIPLLSLSLSLAPSLNRKKDEPLSCITDLPSRALAQEVYSHLYSRALKCCLPRYATRRSYIYYKARYIDCS